MANLPEILQFDAGVYQIETADPVLGGPNGLSNVPLKNLANRTAYLKKHVDDLEAGTTVPPGIATEAFVTAEINKLDNKQSVRAATTANITLAGTQAIDGVNLVSGDRVLVKNQTAPAENGLYVVQGAGWIRTGDADSNADVTPGLVVAVEEGALQGDTVWKLTTNAPIALGTTGLTFADITAGYAPLASPALTGNPTAPTPAQFDNDTSLATTAFVKRALGGFSGYQGVASSRALTAADIGNVLFISSGGWTITAPQPSSIGVDIGGAVTLFGTTGTVSSVAPGAGAAINTSGAVTSVPILAGQSVTLVAVTATTWQAISSTAKLGDNADFGASLAANGYQKLPSGRIEVQGTFTSPSTPGAAVPVSFPISAANCRNIQITPLSTGAAAVDAWFDSPSGSGFNGHCSVASTVCHYRAILD